MNNRTQQASTPKTGETLSAAKVGQMVHKTKDNIVAGKGINIRKMGDQTLIEVKPSGNGGGVGSGDSVPRSRIWYAVDYDALVLIVSQVQSIDLGFITEGDEKGAWYERNADNDGWQGRTIWKTVAS